MATKLTFKQFFHTWTQELLTWLTNKFDSIQIDTSHLATEANATANKNAIITAVNNAQPDLSTVAKQGDNPNATNSAILAAFGNIDFSTLAKQQNLLALADVVGNAPLGSAKATVFAYLSAIWDSIEGQHSEDLPEGLADRIGLLLNFFGITQVTEYIALTPAEVIASSRDEQYNVMGNDWPIPSWLPEVDGVQLTESDIQTAAQTLGIPYHVPTQVS